MDAETNGIANGLTNCITRDGQSPALANIPMGGHKITGLANGTASNDAVTLGQITGLTPTDVTPESFPSWNPADATQALLDACATGNNVSLTKDFIYPYTASFSPTVDFQKIGGQGVLQPTGAIDGILVSGGLQGIELDLTFDAPGHTGTAVRISNANRTIIRRLLCNDVFSVLYVENANTTNVDYIWAQARGSGITLFGNDTLRSDVVYLDFALIGQSAAPTQYGLDWNGNVHSVEIKYLGLVNGQGAIVRNTAGTTTFPAIGRFTHIESDFSTACGIDIQAGLDIDIAQVYVNGAALSGIRIGAAVNNYNVRITGGKSIGSVAGYGIENLGGVVLYGGNTSMFSNALGDTFGTVWNRPIDTRWDDTFFAKSIANVPTIGLDTNDLLNYDRTNNILQLFIGAAQKFAQASAYLNINTVHHITDAPCAPPSITGIIAGTLAQIHGSSDQVGTITARWSNDNKALINYSYKSRATTIGGSGACLANDQIFKHLFYADTGVSAGHAGQVIGYLDGAPTGDPTEQPSAFALYTGTGLHTPGNRTAVVVNSKQQTYLLGQTSTSPAPGADFGANVLIGVGAAGAGQGPLKLTISGAVLQTVPEAGVIEVDTAGVLYVTNSGAKRRRIIDADTGTATITAGAGAGTGPTIAITNGPNSGRITLTTGTTPTLAGTIATVTYGNAFPTDSFVSLTPANGAAATAEKSFFATGTASGFTLTNVTSALPASTQHIWEFTIAGK